MQVRAGLEDILRFPFFSIHFTVLLEWSLGILCESGALVYIYVFVCVCFFLFF